MGVGRYSGAVVSLAPQPRPDIPSRSRNIARQIVENENIKRTGKIHSLSHPDFSQYANNNVSFNCDFLEQEMKNTSEV